MIRARKQNLKKEQESSSVTDLLITGRCSDMDELVMLIHLEKMSPYIHSDNTHSVSASQITPYSLYSALYQTRALVESRALYRE